MRIVIAVGGNALLRCDERSDTAEQLAHVRSAAIALAPIVREHEVVICLGNGPHVDPRAPESSLHAALVHPYPLDAVGAQSQGMIGYWLSQALRNAGIVKPIVNLTTQVLVDSDDVAFSDPTTFVGAVYTESEARAAVDEHGWSIAPDGTGWRRTVPSPSPIRVIEQESITRLVQAGSVVLCGGGGGAPVVEAATGQLRGVDAVIDKDLTATLIALDCDADRLLILTDVPAVVDHFGTAQAEPLGNVYVDELDPTAFAAESMGPKVQACSTFAWATGHFASIGALDDAQNVLDGISGTTVLDRRTEDIAAGRRAV
ncbi:carbamate kinase [Rhodococcus sp. SBT000017]|uniref:amino acid kinase family protein n=1 Tax=Rhodococcus sp. SBT000017 TaxID=1803385 RepID=UPI000EF8A69D|nr:carbamate kinase [Rhodococcus sp. SBT000017]RMB77284.1 carbamate kinase [Rhodococcus sp. SBT000017]